MYNHFEVENKWINKWKIGFVNYNPILDSQKPKKYILVEFPYPSGAGLHVGHVRSYVALDIMARTYRMKGYNVLFPMGWDAFGLPTENYAIKHKMKPQVATEQNVEAFKQQLQMLGLSFAWKHEINTTDPDYYKWTQWIFLQLFKKGLAYKDEFPINWCPQDKIGLAFEEVVDGKCERCGTPVQKKVLNQWMLKITEYADKLLEGLDVTDYLPQIKAQQTNWIGKSEGAEIYFDVKTVTDNNNFFKSESQIIVFTTRPDTMYGVTYLVLALDHQLIQNWLPVIQNSSEVEQYIQETASKTDRDRQQEKQKTGVELQGIKAIHPFTQEPLPVYIADYVLSGYGTGAIMAVPAHDQRDFEFAQKFGLEIKHVVQDVSETKEISLDKAFIQQGLVINSNSITGLTSQQASEQIIQELEQKGLGNKKITYKLRDWVFSRQHYWGEPIPIIHCKQCGMVPVLEDQLPIKLPDVKAYEPTDTGESPLAVIEDWVNVNCPQCSGPAKRETDTMPNWAGSSWYYLRYTDPNNSDRFASADKLKYWLEVDLYNGGMEHVTLHLLYSRFWHKFLYDQGYVPTPEPYKKRIPHGMVLGEGGIKMSKSKGNVVNPNEMVEAYGADALRVYEMFMGPYDESIAWDTNGLVGCYRFLNKVWEWGNAISNQDYPASVSSPEELTSIHGLIKKVSHDIDEMKFNTAVSAFMEFTNLFHTKKNSQETFEQFLILLAPFAPHMTEELWELLGHKESIHNQMWPTFNESYLFQASINYVVQVNGKVRANIEMPTDTSEDLLKSTALDHEHVQKFIQGKEVRKIIVVPNKLINIVV